MTSQLERSWLKKEMDIDLWSMSCANLSSGSEQMEVIVTARAMGDTWSN